MGWIDIFKPLANAENPTRKPQTVPMCYCRSPAPPDQALMSFTLNALSDRDDDDAPGRRLAEQLENVGSIRGNVSRAV